MNDENTTGVFVIMTLMMMIAAVFAAAGYVLGVNSVC